MDIASQIAIVTGGASGLGAATARALAAAGARVGLIDKNIEKAEALARQIAGAAAAADVASTSEMEAAFASISATLGGGPRVLVNCAGIGTAARILPRDGTLSIDAFSDTLRINLLGTYVGLSLAAREMAKLAPCTEDGETGVIINTASIAFEDGQIGQAAYAASKGGVAALTLPAARELARLGIRVLAIAPGLFETAMTEGLPEESRAAILASMPFPRRFGHADEFGALVCHAIANPMLNGSVLRLDGAVRLPIR